MERRRAVEGILQALVYDVLGGRVPENETWSEGRKVPQSQRSKEGRASEEKRRVGGGAGGAVRAVGMSSAVNVEVLTLCIVDNHVFGNGLMYNGN